MEDDTIVLFIVLRKSLHLDDKQIAYCVANAMQHFMYRYFKLQVGAVITHSSSLMNDNHLLSTTKWLSSQAKKNIIDVDDDIWEKLKQQYPIGKDCFCLREPELTNMDAETTLILWPSQYSDVPDYLKASRQDEG